VVGVEVLIQIKSDKPVPRITTKKRGHDDGLSLSDHGLHRSDLDAEHQHADRLHLSVYRQPRALDRDPAATTDPAAMTCAKRADQKTIAADDMGSWFGSVGLLWAGAQALAGSARAW